MSLILDTSSLLVKAKLRQYILHHFNKESVDFMQLNLETFQADYNNFIEMNFDLASKLDKLRPAGVGPGELILWFLFDEITLGGKNSSIDLLFNGLPFAEVKGGVYIKKDNAITDFKISKDADPAVHLILRDLEAFNNKYEEITGSKLAYWRDGDISKNTLNAYSHIDLERLARKYSGPIRGNISLLFSSNGEIYQNGIMKSIANWHDDTFHDKIAEFMVSDVQIAVDNNISTIKKIVGRWRAQAYLDYIKGKNFVLIDSKKLTMLHFGAIKKNAVDLNRICRNQPQARILLNKVH
jgi:hypothetical protein